MHPIARHSPLPKAKCVHMHETAIQLIKFCSHLALELQQILVIIMKVCALWITLPALDSFHSARSDTEQTVNSHIGGSVLDNTMPNSWNMQNQGTGCNVCRSMDHNGNTQIVSSLLGPAGPSPPCLGLASSLASNLNLKGSDVEADFFTSQSSDRPFFRLQLCTQLFVLCNSLNQRRDKSRNRLEVPLHSRLLKNTCMIHNKPKCFGSS